MSLDTVKFSFVQYQSLSQDNNKNKAKQTKQTQNKTKPRESYPESKNKLAAIIQSQVLNNRYKLDVWELI